MNDVEEVEVNNLIFVNILFLIYKKNKEVNYYKINIKIMYNI